jgi:hypothetical protein
MYREHCSPHISTGENATRKVQEVDPMPIMRPCHQVVITTSSATSDYSGYHLSSMCNLVMSKVKTVERLAVLS